MRQNQGSMICPHCGKLIGVGEERCPFCGAWRPGLYGYAPAIQRLFGRRLDLITLIVTTCVILYVTALVLQPEAILQMRGLFSILSPGMHALYLLGMTSSELWRDGWWWTLLTAIYLHGGILHILFNMLWIRSLGPAVTDVYGPARAFILFSITGAFGFLISDMAPPWLGGGVPSIGASGSIFGLLAALIVYGRKRGAHTMSSQLWTWAIILFAFGFMMRGVNNWAHGGGFVSGWLIASMMRFDDEKRESPLLQVAALGLILVTLLGFAMSFVRVTAILARGG